MTRCSSGTVMVISNVTFDPSLIGSDADWAFTVASKAWLTSRAAAKLIANTVFIASSYLMIVVTDPKPWVMRCISQRQPLLETSLHDLGDPVVGVDFQTTDIAGM